MTINTNHHKWPGVVSRDVMIHVGGLKGNVYTFSGQVKGNMLLPLPLLTEALVRASKQQARWVIDEGLGEQRGYVLLVF